MKAIVTLLLALPLSLAVGKQIEFSGIAANSGEKLSPLVEFGTPQAYGMGIVVDRYGSIWDRGGAGRLNRYAPDGRLLASYPIPKNTGRWDRIALHNHEEILLLIAGEIYRLPIDAAPGTPPQKTDQKADHITTSTYNGELALWHQGSLRRWNIATGEASPIIPETIPDIYDINYGENGSLLLLERGRTFYLPPGAKSSAEIQTKPSFGNSLQMIDGFWYGAMGHGTYRRFNKDFEADPGVILGGASGSFIGYVEQVPEIEQPQGIQKIWPNLYAISGKTGVIHLATWDPEKKQLSVVSRIGSLPECHGVGLNSKGEIWFRSGIWKWNDRPEAPQTQGSAISTHTQVVNLPNDQFVTVGQRYGKQHVYAGDFTWRVHGVLAPEIPPKALPLAAATFKADRAFALLSLDRDGNGREIQIATNGHFQKDLGAAKIELTSPLKNWTSLASKDATTLYAAAEGWLVELQRKEGTWKEVRRVKEWGTDSSQKFGEEIHITSDTENLWVSDTARHRVVVLSLHDLKPVAEYGLLGQKGNDLAHLNSPAAISTKNNRTVVFDRGNQRLVKLTLK